MLYACCMHGVCYCYICGCIGGLELEGVEVRVEINDKDRTKVEDLIPKQVKVNAKEVAAQVRTQCFP